jgi:hypothetical protein
MKKIYPLIVIGILIICGAGAGGKINQTAQEKHTIIFNEYNVVDDEKDVVSVFGFRGPIINLLFRHMDMLSFSIYEEAERPEFLYMKMEIGKIKFTELRSIYNIIWDYNGLLYCTGLHTLNSSETILDYSAYYEEDGTEHKIWNTSVDIDENNGLFTWTITKDDLGVKAGDVFENPYAKSLLMTKKLDGLFKIRFAMDEIEPGPNYIVQY